MPFLVFLVVIFCCGVGDLVESRDGIFGVPLKNFNEAGGIMIIFSYAVYGDDQTSRLCRYIKQQI
jgi:hypothetical protein